MPTSTDRPPQPDPVQPTVVLVHGAWHGAWCWDEITARLDRGGLATTAIELPFTGAKDDIAAVRAALDGIDGPKVLVGHSYGGNVISGAADGRDDVVHLVYVCAFLLAAGSHMLELVERVEPERRQAVAATKLFESLVVGDDGRSSIDPNGAVEAFYNTSPATLAAAATGRLRAMDATAVTRRAAAEPWRWVSTTYVVCEQDQCISPDAQRLMAQGRAGEIVSLDCDHSPFLSMPDELTLILSEVAR